MGGRHDLVRSGVPGREARRRARIHFGSVEGMKDGCRQARGLRVADELERLMANIRLALRMLLKTPVVTSVAVVSLALGIGANAALFSLAPAGFRGTTLNMPSMIFVPLTMNGRLNRFADEDRFEDRRNYWLYLFARLKPQVSIDQARAAVAPLYRSILTDVEAPLQTDMSDETLARFVAKPPPIEDGRRGQSGMHDSVGAPLLLLLAAAAAAALALAAVALGAGFVPAHRASRVNPMAALRHR